MMTHDSSEHSPISLSFPRPALMQWLDDQQDNRATLMIAPAGSGKTTTAIHWLRHSSQQRPTLWLTLTPRDNNLLHFLQRFVRGIATFDPALGRSVMRRLEDKRRLPLPALLKQLGSELAQWGQHATIVIDQFELVTRDDLQSMLQQMLHSFPPLLHIILLSRKSTRFTNNLVKQKGVVLCPPEQLAFSASEAKQWLGSAATELLLDACQGNPFDLKLAAHLWHSAAREQLTSILSEKLAVRTKLFDRLLESVSPQHKALLLDGSEIPFLNHTLASDILQSPDAPQQLDALVRSIPFFDVTQLEQIQMEPLLRQTLRQRLRAGDSERVYQLNRYAAAWHATQGNLFEQINHTFFADDGAAAAALINQYLAEQPPGEQRLIPAGWLRVIHASIAQSFPFVTLARAEQAVENEANSIQPEADAWLDNTDASIVDEERPVDATTSAIIRGAVDLLRLIQTQNKEGRPAEIILYGKRFLKRIPDVSATRYARSAIMSMVGVSYLQRGNSQQAAAFLDEAYELAAACRSLTIACGSRYLQSTILRLSGDPKQAVQLCRAALHAFQAEHRQQEPAVGGLLIALGTALLHLNKLEEAEDCLREGLPLAQLVGEQGIIASGWTALFQLQLQKRAYDDAAATLQEMVAIDQDGRLVPMHAAPYWLNFADNIPTLWEQLAQVAASNEAYFDGTPIKSLVGSRPFAIAELHAVILIRLAQRKRGIACSLEAATRQLDAQIEWDRTKKWDGRLTLLLILRALLFAEIGDVVQAEGAFSEALGLGEPAGNWRPFLQHAEQLLPLLNNSQNHAHDAIVTLLRQQSERPIPQPDIQLLPLEKAILDGLAKRNNRAAIANQQQLSLAATEWYCQSLYQKLGVANRNAAVVRARQLGILSKS